MFFPMDCTVIERSRPNRALFPATVGAFLPNEIEHAPDIAYLHQDEANEAVVKCRGDTVVVKVAKQAERGHDQQHSDIDAWSTHHGREASQLGRIAFKASFYSSIQNLWDVRRRAWHREVLHGAEHHFCCLKTGGRSLAKRLSFATDRFPSE
ncbi:hypothetical protein [Rhizobium tibeticum]|uniref:hypothetical protein n=1 Tax=Rhizobium tibeticum TaxID=501024 RepID=UPI0014288CD8|nr:hypothetical protein [Rhizobium tibeticum]